MSRRVADHLQLASSDVTAVRSMTVGGSYYGQTMHRVPDGIAHAYDPTSLATAICGAPLEKLKRWNLSWADGTFQRCPKCLDATSRVNTRSRGAFARR